MAIRQGDNPPEYSFLFKRRGKDSYREEAVQCQVPLPLHREAGDGKGRMRGWGWLAASRAPGGAVEPVPERANGVEAELAPIVINTETCNCGLSGLGPLPTTGRRGQVASMLGLPEVAHFTSALRAGVPFDERTCMVPG